MDEEKASCGGRRRSRTQASRAHRVNSHDENRKLQLSENSAHRGSYQHWRVCRGCEHVHFPALADRNSMLSHVVHMHAPKRTNARVGPGSVQRSCRPISVNVRAQNGSGRGSYPSELAPSRFTCPPTRPSATYLAPRRHSVPVLQRHRQLHSLSGFTTVHPSSEFALSFSRLTMGRAPFQAVDEQDDTALDPH